MADLSRSHLIFAFRCLTDLSIFKFQPSMCLFTIASFLLAASLTCWSFEPRDLGITLLGLSCLLIVCVVSGYKNTVLMLSSVAFSLGVAEFTLKAAQTEQKVKYSEESDVGKRDYRTKSDLGYQGRAGTYRSKLITLDGETIYDVLYSIGDDGFRITPLNTKKGRIRINFFGCSFTFGEGLNDDQSVPSFLHTMDRSITVKNFAWGGYGVHQALRILESRRDTKGDINFLLTAAWQADRSACIPDYSEGSPRYRLTHDGDLLLDGACDNGSAPSSFWERILISSNIYQRIKSALRQSQDQQIDLYLAIINRMRMLSQARNQRFIVGYMKVTPSWFVGQYSNERIVQTLREQGIEVLDVSLGHLGGKVPRQYYIHPLDKHPSALANEARAKMVKDYLDTAEVHASLEQGK